MVFLNGIISSDTNKKLSITISDFTSPSTGDRLIIGRNAQFNNISLDIKAVTGTSFGPFFEAKANDSVVEVWTKGINLDSLVSFENLYFILPSDIQNGDTILNLGSSNISIGTTDKPYHIGVATQPGVNLEVGNRVVLINRTTGELTENTQVSMDNISLEGGAFTTDYIFGLSLDETDRALIATVTDKKINDEIKAPVEGQMATIALLNTGSDLIADIGLENAIVAAKDENIAGFSAVSGGFSKYKTGSYINLLNASLLTGIARNLTDNSMLGAFVEAGYGRYSTHNTFSKGKVKGDGVGEYYGFGLIGRYNIIPSLYADASIRVGYLNNNWESDDTKVAVDYDTDSLYYGAHFALNYDTNIDDKLNLNFYGKYFYNHQNGDDTQIDGTQFRFQDIDSHISRFGTRLFSTVADKVRPFIGIAWNHEFGGRADAFANNIVIEAPSLKGDTGMFELGLKTGAVSVWNFDASLQAFVGQRFGLQGLVKAKYIF